MSLVIAQALKDLIERPDPIPSLASQDAAKRGD